MLQQILQIALWLEMHLVSLSTNLLTKTEQLDKTMHRNIRKTAHKFLGQGELL